MAAAPLQNMSCDACCRMLCPIQWVGHRAWWPRHARARANAVGAACRGGSSTLILFPHTGHLHSRCLLFSVRRLCARIGLSLDCRAFLTLVSPSHSRACDWVFHWCFRLLVIYMTSDSEQELVATAGPAPALLPCAAALPHVPQPSRAAKE